MVRKVASHARCRAPSRYRGEPRRRPLEGRHRCTDRSFPTRRTDMTDQTGALAHATFPVTFSGRRHCLRVIHLDVTPTARQLGTVLGCRCSSPYSTPQRPNRPWRPSTHLGGHRHRSRGPPPSPSLTREQVVQGGAGAAVGLEPIGGPGWVAAHGVGDEGADAEQPDPVGTDSSAPQVERPGGCTARCRRRRR